MLNFPLIPESASTFASKVDPLFYFLCLLTVAGTAGVFALVVGLAWKFRAGDGEERPSEPLENELIEPVWSIAGTILFVAIFFWGMFLYFDFLKEPEGALEIDVVGKQWMWKIQHPDGQREVNTLHVPIGQPVRLTMTSQDVLHDFYIPAFRVKQDVLPGGRYSKLWFEATKPGEYHLFCAEYCGTEHSLMGGKVIAMEPEDYIEWLQGGPKMSPQEAGEFLYTQLGCATCHTGKANARGPALNGLYGKTVALAGGESVVVDDDYLRESILQPQAKLVEGYPALMPTNFANQLSPEQLNYLVAYIKSLAADEQTD